MLNWCPETFWNATPKELHLALAGYILAEREKRQSNLQAAYELARWEAAVYQTFYINAHRKRGQTSKLIKPQDIAAFPWEKTEKEQLPKVNLDKLRQQIESLDAGFIQALKAKR